MYGRIKTWYANTLWNLKKNFYKLDSKKHFEARLGRITAESGFIFAASLIGAHFAQDYPLRLVCKTMNTSELTTEERLASSVSNAKMA